MGMDKDFLICGKNISTHTRLVENGLGHPGIICIRKKNEKENLIISSF